MTKIYLVQVHTTDPEEKDDIKILSEEDKEKTVYFQYRFSRDVRTAIRRVRDRYLRKFRSATFNFYGLKLVAENSLSVIEETARAMANELSSINSNVHGSVTLTPITLDSGNSDLANLINQEIKRHIFTDIRKRLEHYIEQPMSGKGKTAILRALETMQNQNILSSEEVSHILSSLRIKVEGEEEVQTIVQEVEAQLELMKKDISLVEV